MYKVELWGISYETSMRDYTFRTIIKPLESKKQCDLGLASKGESYVWQLAIGLYYSVVGQTWIQSPEVHSSKEYDDLMAYAKCRIESAVKINEPPLSVYASDLKLNRLNPVLPPVKANQKWIKTPKRLLQVDKIDHIREVPTDDGGGTFFVHVNGEELHEAQLPFEEACKLLLNTVNEGKETE